MASIDLLDQITKVGATNDVGSLGFTGLTNPNVADYEKKKLEDQIAADLAKASAGGSDPSLPSQNFNGSFGQFMGVTGNALGALSGLISGNPLSVVMSGKDLLSYDPAKPTMTSLTIDSILSAMGINQIGATQAPAPITALEPTSFLGPDGLPVYALGEDAGTGYVTNSETGYATDAEYSGISDEGVSFSTSDDESDDGGW